MNKQELIEELECLGVPTDSYNYLRGANYAVEKAISLAKQLDEPKKLLFRRLLINLSEKMKTLFMKYARGQIITVATIEHVEILNYQQ